MVGKITFRTIFGGPAMPAEYDQELKRIKAHLKSATFEYEVDFTLTIGGDLISVTYPTGLRSPRVYPERRRVTGAIYVNNDDIRNQTDHRMFLRSTINDAIVDVFKRIKKRDPTFDYEAELSKAELL